MLLHTRFILKPQSVSLRASEWLIRSELYSYVLLFPVHNTFPLISFTLIQWYVDELYGKFSGSKSISSCQNTGNTIHIHAHNLIKFNLQNPLENFANNYI